MNIPQIVWWATVALTAVLLIRLTVAGIEYAVAANAMGCGRAEAFRKEAAKYQTPEVRRLLLAEAASISAEYGCP